MGPILMITNGWCLCLHIVQDSEERRSYKISDQKENKSESPDRVTSKNEGSYGDKNHLQEKI
jgi:hypothetical protein